MRYRRGEIEEALYDLETDPDERRNLAKQDEHASRLAMMAARMAELLVEFKAPPTWMDAVQPGSVKNPGR